MNNVRDMVENQKRFFQGGQSKDLCFRLKKLNMLKTAIINMEDEIMEGLKKDLDKSPFEAYETEIGFVLEEIDYTIRHLRSWIKPKRVRTPLKHILSSSYIYNEPYGVTLIISPWNYPFHLSIAPLIGSIAAGNCVILKPSEHSPNTSAVIEKLIHKNFDQGFIKVMQGGIEANKELLEEKFDYIFFTGSTSVGKIIMESASKFLTPVTLELGGKSPCIVDQTADIDLAAKRIVWGKYLNAGQTCVAPDYLLVHSSKKVELIDRMNHYIREFYGSDPCSNIEYPKIINKKHYDRLLNLMDGVDILVGGNVNYNALKITPTILDNVDWDSPIMQEEIFGPLLPVLQFKDINQVVSQLNDQSKPLALYFFSRDKSKERQIINSISFGGGCINDTLIYLATPYMPFGGVGESGMGLYHGKASFDTFSHKKGIMRKSNLLDIPLRYPPFKNKIKLLKKIMR